MRTITWQRRGFTLLEIMIVVTVLAILAGISVVGYNGYQARTNATAVRSEILEIGQNIDISSMTAHEFPAADTASLSAFKFKITQKSYDKTIDNVIYCVDTARKNFAIGAKTQSSDKVFIFVKAKGIQETTTALTADSVCTAAGVAAGDRHTLVGYPSGTLASWLGSV